MPTYIVKPDVGDALVGSAYYGNMELFERLKFARKRSGLTQQEVADHFKIARVSVTQWEGDTSRPDQGKFGGLSDLYGVPLVWLLDGRGDPPAPIGASLPKGKEPTVIRRPKPRRIFLKEHRENMNAKVAELAKAIGRDADHYEYLEQHPFKLSVEHLDILAKKIGVTFDQLWFPPPVSAKSAAPSTPSRRAKKQMEL